MALLRAWERRYGVVAPARTASGYRLYDEAAIERLRTMRRLVDAGWAPSTAAASILDGSITADRPWADAVSSDRDAAGSLPARVDTAEELARRLIDAARDYNTAELDAVLDDMFSRGSFERVADDLLFPALRRLGDAWSSGEVTVGGEHLASAAVLRRLGLALDAAGSGGGRGPTVVIGLPPGGRHEFGALAFAVAARRSGMTVRYVGPDLPIDDWVAAAASADGAVIGVVTPIDRRPGVAVAERIREMHPDVMVALGGSAAPDMEHMPKLSGALSKTVTDLAAALDQWRARPL